MDALCLPLRPEALTTPDRARAFGAGLAGVHENALVFAINAISEAAQRYVGRPLHQQTTTEEEPEFHQGGGHWLQLRLYPVASIESVRVDGSPIGDYSSARQWLRDGRLFREDGWPFMVPRHNDLTGDPDFSRPAWNIAVAYTGGYMTPLQEEEGVEEGTPLPTEIELAVIREVSDLLNGARNTGRILREKTAGGYEVTYAMSGVVNLSRETQDTLRGYVLPVMP